MKIIGKLRVMIFMVLLLTEGCSHSDMDKKFERNYGAFINDFKVDTSMVRIVSFDTMSSFNNWQKVFIFRPYTPINEVNRQLGFVWSDAESTHIHDGDGFSLIVFANLDEVVSYSLLPTDSGDFRRLDSNGPFYAGSVTFTPMKEKFGDQDWIFAYQK